MDISTPAKSLKKGYGRVPSEEDTVDTPVKESRRDNVFDIESRVPGEPETDDTPYWIVIPILLYVIVLIVITTVRSNFLESHLPAVRILRIEVGEINVVATNVDAVMTVAVNLAVFLEASNDDSKAWLRYTEMNASVAASGVQFGAVRLADMRQPPKNSTTLVVAAAMKDVVMDGRSARDFQSNVEAHVLIIDVSVKGRIDVVAGGKKKDGCPFSVECRSINQSDVIGGRAAPCIIDFTLL